MAASTVKLPVHVTPSAVVREMGTAAFPAGVKLNWLACNGSEAVSVTITLPVFTGDNGKVEIGTPVEMVTRRLREDGDKGMLVYGYKFRPRVLSDT